MLVFTSCVNNYLARARVLAKSLKEFHPDWRFCLLLAEEPLESLDIATEPFDVIMTPDALGLPNLEAWKFQHTLVELCTAIKGAALKHFLEVERQEKVIYLDPDILVLDSLAPLEEMLDRHDILLTPHQLAPQDSSRAIVDNEICSLRHGVFNLGFLACARRPEGLAFSQFWSHRLRHFCHDDKERGLFTDQKWCDLAPAYFPSLGIIRDPGYNAASWNLTDRRITRGPDGKFLANDKPLRFYHFTGHASGAGKLMSSIYGAQMPAVAELWSLYEEKLARNGHASLTNLPWSGSTFNDGSAIPDDARIYYRDHPAIQALFPRPFNASGSDGYAAWWRSRQLKEGNKLYVFVRKPFRLLALTAMWLRKNGGVRSAPKLARRVSDVFRQGGAKGLLAKIRKYKNDAIPEDTGLRLDKLLNLKEGVDWSSQLFQSFSGREALLVIDHMYGGGANDYRDQRVSDWLASGGAALLATWDFFSHRMRLKFHLPDGQAIDAEAPDLAAILHQDRLRFGHILLNELVLWSTSQAPRSGGAHHLAVADILETIGKIKEKNGATYEIAVNDFHAICPSYNLLENGESFCGAPTDSPDRCQTCLANSPFDIPKGFDLAAWRSAWQRAFDQADIVSAFSRSSVEIMTKVFNFRQGQPVIKLHEPLECLPPIAPAPGSLRIGVVGHISEPKGAKIVSEIAGMLKDGESMTVIGFFDGSLPKNVRATGQYRRHELPELLKSQGVNCCLIPSIWPETFCYTAQEVMLMNMPLVVMPLGAQAERVAGYSRGQVAASVSAAAALEAARALHARQAPDRDNSRSDNAADES